MKGYGIIKRCPSMDEVRSAVSCARIIHAYLIVGEKGVGKRSFARYLAMMLLSGDINPSEDNPTIKKVNSNSHADLKWISPSGKSILIDQVRTILADAYIKPFEAE